MSKPIFTVLGLLAPFALLSDPNVRTATLEAKPGSRITGTARTGTLGADSLRVTIDVQGAPARSEIPWAVHQGSCRAVGAVHGDPSAYPPLVTDFTGETWETAALPVGLAPGREYTVVIRRLGALNGDITACGELKEGME